MKGTIKRFYFRKGFGFIEDLAGVEYFFHYSDFTGEKRQIVPEQEVSFEAQQGPKGPSAVNVQIAPGSAAIASAAPRPPRAVPVGAPRNGVSKSRTAPAVRSPAKVFSAGVTVGMVVGASAYAWMAELL